MSTSAPQKVMLITGTRKGIGRYLSEYFGGQGYRIIGCSRENAEPIPNVKYEHFCADVGDETRVLELFDLIATKYGRLDILINNAGIASMNHFLLTPTSTVEKVFRTNVLGTFLFAREAAKIMKKHKWGRIVNFATVATPLKLEGEAVYAASKAAVVSLTEIMARELATLGITVNAIGPTPIETDLIRSVPKGLMDRLIDRQAIHRMGSFQDVSNAIEFFIKEESDFITGQTLYLGGV